jgi:hypothetical protein
MQRQRAGGEFAERVGIGLGSEWQRFFSVRQKAARKGAAKRASDGSSGGGGSSGAVGGASGKLGLHGLAEAGNGNPTHSPLKTRGAIRTQAGSLKLFAEMAITISGTRRYEWRTCRRRDALGFANN